MSHTRNALDESQVYAEDDSGDGGREATQVPSTRHRSDLFASDHPSREEFGTLQ